MQSHSQRSDESKEIKWIRHLPGEHEGAFLSVGKLEESYLIRFANIADFWLDLQQLTVRWTVESPSQQHSVGSAVYLGRNQVLPMLLSSQDNLILHASACILETGQAIAFSGPSGIGKSTLAQAMNSIGQTTPLADDWVVLGSDKNGTTVYAYDEDVASEIAPSSPRLGREHQEQHSFELGKLTEFQTARYPISAVYLLEDSKASKAIELIPMGPKDAYLTLARNLFRLDSASHPQLLKEVGLLSRLLANTLVYRLRYPREREGLGKLVQELLSHGPIPT